MRGLSLALRYRVAFFLAASLVISAVLVPHFFSITTLGLGLDRVAAMGLVAVGLTVLLISGQIDLSGGAVFAVSGLVAIMLQPTLGIGLAAAVGALTGAAAGAINGLLVVRMGINSLVATLASMLMFRSVAHWVSGSQPISGADVMFSLAISHVYFGVLTLRSALFLVAILLLQVWLVFTVSGRNLFAVGSSPLAAEASGIDTSRIFFLGLVFASILAGVAGVLQSLSTNTGSPVFGADLTVIVIAAVVVGGTRIEGGRGSALGTLGGILTMAMLTTAMEFQSVPAYFQQVVSGLILLLLVILDRTIRTKSISAEEAPALSSQKVANL
jgi:ribose transport system permease protein